MSLVKMGSESLARAERAANHRQQPVLFRSLRWLRCSVPKIRCLSVPSDVSSARLGPAARAYHRIDARAGDGARTLLRDDQLPLIGIERSDRTLD